MNVTQKLMDEHKLILEYIRLIQTLLRTEDLNKRDNFISNSGSRIIDFIQNFADRYHHAKEENILFKYMGKPRVLSHCNPLPQMLYEHSQGRESVAGMIQSLNDKDFTLFCENALAYAILLEQHIYKEDNILYSMAEEGLTLADKEAIHEEYKAAEKKYNEKQDLPAYYTEMLIALNDMLQE